MTEKHKDLQVLFQLIFPQELFEYFQLVSINSTDNEVHFYLEELNSPPDKYSSEKLISKGFHKEHLVQDFPIRDKATYLHIKRRRWLIESTGEVVSRDWNTVAKGTHLTQGFATFLKGLFG